MSDKSNETGSKKKPSNADLLKAADSVKSTIQPAMEDFTMHHGLPSDVRHLSDKSTEMSKKESLQHDQSSDDKKG